MIKIFLNDIITLLGVFLVPSGVIVALILWKRHRKEDAAKARQILAAAEKELQQAELLKIEVKAKDQAVKNDLYEWREGALARLTEAFDKQEAELVEEKDKAKQLESRCQQKERQLGRLQGDYNELKNDYSKLKIEYNTLIKRLEEYIVKTKNCEEQVKELRDLLTKNK